MVGEAPHALALLSRPHPQPTEQPCSLWRSLLTPPLHESIFIPSARKHLSTHSCSSWQTPAHHSTSSFTASSCSALTVPFRPPAGRPPHPRRQHCTPPERLLPARSLPSHQSPSSWRTALGVLTFLCPAVSGTKQTLNKCWRRNKQKNEELWKYFSNNSIRKTSIHACARAHTQSEISNFPNSVLLRIKLFLKITAWHTYIGYCRQKVMLWLFLI